MILRCYPRAFRDRWAVETLELFAELARTRPGGPRSTVRLWADHLPDLIQGLLGEWSRELVRRLGGLSPAVTHGVLAGALLSAATLAGNLGSLWQTTPGHAASWLTCAAALVVLARTGPATGRGPRRIGRGPRRIGRSARNGLAGGLIAFTAANLTATIVVITAMNHLSHDSLQMTAFVASHEADFRIYQLHELLGGWTYGSICGAVLGALLSAVTAAVQPAYRGESRM